MSKKKIYVASSWRNSHQPHIVHILREEGYDVYDFRNPSKDDHGFNWAEIDPNWKNWTLNEYLNGLTANLAHIGFYNDYNAMKWADICILVLPCGRSAHLEAGWIRGANKILIIYIPEKPEPELSYKMANYICGSIEDLLKILEAIKKE